MLYDGSIRHLCLARERMRSHDIGARHEHLLRAQGIIATLIGSLDHEKGGEVAANLQRLYVYMYRRLVEANLLDDPQRIDEVVQMMRELRGCWEEADAIESRDGRVSAA